MFWASAWLVLPPAPKLVFRLALRECYVPPFPGLCHAPANGKLCRARWLDPRHRHQLRGRRHWSAVSQFGVWHGAWDGVVQRHADSESATERPEGQQRMLREPAVDRHHDMQMWADPLASRSVLNTSSRERARGAATNYSIIARHRSLDRNSSSARRLRGHQPQVARHHLWL